MIVGYILSFVLFLVLVLVIQRLRKATSDLERFKPILEIEEHVELLKAESSLEVEKLRKTIESKKTELDAAEQEVAKIRRDFEQVSSELKILNEDHDLLSSGFYKAKYDFEDSKAYESRLDEIRQKQKAMIKDKNAIVCSKTWTVDGSEKEGRKLIDRVIKLGLSAFNVQCDNEVLRVKFDNIDRAEEKINKLRDNIDKLLEPYHCNITHAFLKLKLEELFLAYEFQQKVYEEKQEQKQIREQMRDEEKARREAEKAQAEAEREERRYEAALEKAKRELDSKSDKDREAFLAKIQDLQAKLDEAHANKERAKSMAELTRQGYVYIISNIGSFGEDVFKIGMTRRLDPQDRVDELGDASVPFEFDVHAMIRSEDAPKLEAALHRKFDSARLNKVNSRKEFFRVPLSAIEQACRENNVGDFRLTLLAEAKEWRQSIAQEKQQKRAA